MTFNFTKILIPIIALILIGAVIFAVYYFFFQDESPGLSSGTGKEIVIEPKPGPKPVPLSQEKVLSPFLDKKTQSVKYYDRANGNLFNVNFDGTGLSRVSAASLSGILKIIWAPDAKKVIGFFQEGDSIKKYLHDYQLGQSTSLNEGVEQAAWSPDGKKIAVLTYDENSKTNIISVANQDAGDLKTIFSTRLKDLILEWPAIDKISLRSKASGLSSSLVMYVNPDNGDFTTVLTDIYGLSARWSPLGNTLLYSATNTSGKNIQLFKIDQNGQNRASLGLLTMVEKCVFFDDNRTLACAMPQKISANAVWPDDYYKGAVTTSDSFWKINLDNSQKELLYQAAEIDKNYDATDLFLSLDEDYLFFVNKKDGLLYSLLID